MRLYPTSLCLVTACIAMWITASCSIVINEVELNPPEGGTNWAELYNTGNSSMDISGWTVKITDSAWVGEMPVPEGAIIPAKGFYVINGSPSWTHNGGGFTALYDDAGKKVDQTDVRQDTLGNAFTYGLYPDGNTEGGLGLMGPTKGKPNVL